jgi:hypothetical protein
VRAHLRGHDHGVAVQLVLVLRVAAVVQHAAAAARAGVYTGHTQGVAARRAGRGRRPVSLGMKHTHTHARAHTHTHLVLESPRLSLLAAVPAELPDLNHENHPPPPPPPACPLASVLLPVLLSSVSTACACVYVCWSGRWGVGGWVGGWGRGGLGAGGGLQDHRAEGYCLLHHRQGTSHGTCTPSPRRAPRRVIHPLTMSTHTHTHTHTIYTCIYVYNI